MRTTTFRSSVLGVLLLSLYAGPLLAAGKPLEVKDFELGKDGAAEAIVDVGEPGTLSVRVRLEQPLATAPVGLWLHGPDGVQVEKKGSAPLRLRYDVTTAEQLGSWRATVRNVGKMSRLAGQVQVSFTAAAPAGETEAAPARAARVTDGKITSHQNLQRIRAVCRDRNRDVSVRLDLESGTGGLFLKYNRALALAPSETSGGVIELGGSGEAPLYLDTERRVLFFRGGEKGIFCKVRIYYGEG